MRKWRDLSYPACFAHETPFNQALFCCILRSEGMKSLTKLVLLGVLLALVVTPVLAQDPEDNVIIDGSFGESIVNSLNPITYSSATDSGLLSLMIPLLWTADPETALIQPGVPGTVAESWDVSEDGGTITFHLKDTFSWPDGTPVTARDWEFVWDAVQSGEVETRLVFNDPFIDEMTAIDDYTLEVTLEDPNCESITNVPQLPFPSHMFTDADGNPDWAAVNAETFTDPETFPAIGPYQLSVLQNDQQVGVVPAENWPEGEGYPVSNEGYILKLVGDQTILIEQLLAGDIDMQDFIPPDRRADVRAAENLSNYEFNPGNVWDYLALNYANPDNPQNSTDDAGNPIEQDPHPIFGDVRVREALAHGLNMEDVVEAALFGEGVAMASMYPPGTWVYPEDLQMYEYDPELALEMLAEAGWVDDDNDPSTPLVATEDALYAEPGTPFTFTLFTNQGNTRRTAFGQIAQDQLSDIGVQVDFQTIDFNVLLDLMDAQTFDAVILGWQNGYPYTADMTQLFATVSDTIGGDNFTSWHSAEFDALQLQALTLPGCDTAERAAIYAQAAQVYHEGLPYIAQFGTSGFFAWNSRVNGVDPFPNNMSYNISEWTKTP